MKLKLEAKKVQRLHAEQLLNSTQFLFFFLIWVTDLLRKVRKDEMCCLGGEDDQQEQKRELCR